jgi:hypothetical protein
LLLGISALIGATRIQVPDDVPSLTKVLKEGVKFVPLDEKSLDDDEPGLLAVMSVNNIDNWTVMSDSEIQLVNQLVYITSLEKPNDMHWEAYVMKKFMESGGDGSSFTEADITNALSYTFTAEKEHLDEIETMHLYHVNPQEFKLPCSYIGAVGTVPAKYPRRVD